MNWNWKKDFKRNIIKVGFHIGFEYTILASWYIALEGDPIFWPIGIASAFIIHVIVFTKIDFLHELHHHHKQSFKTLSHDCQHGEHFSCQNRKPCTCICHKSEGTS